LPRLPEELSKILWKNVPLIAVVGLSLFLSMWFPSYPASTAVVAVFLVVFGIVALAVILAGGNPLKHVWIITLTTVKIIVGCIAIVIGVALLSGLLTLIFPSWQ